MVIVFNATFNNISVISFRSVYFVEKTGVPAENHRPVASHWQTLSHNVCCKEYTLSWTGFELTTLVVIGTDCKSNYHTITTMTAPFNGLCEIPVHIHLMTQSHNNYVNLYGHCIFLRFWYLILELFRHCDVFCFTFYNSFLSSH